MKIVAISDLHGNFPKIPELLDQEIDLLLVVGDIAGGSHITNAQYKSMGKFFKWVEVINPKNCVITQGNHDYWQWGQLFNYNERPRVRTHHLIDGHVDIDGLIVHGTPWSIPFLNWNWMKPEERLIPHWENIHPGTDILINHCPAFGTADVPLMPIHGGKRKFHMGSKTLLDELLTRQIPYFFSGHVHSADHEFTQLSEHVRTKCACVSILNEEYEYAYKPTIIEV